MLLPQMSCAQDLWWRYCMSLERRPSCIYKIYPTFPSLQENNCTIYLELSKHTGYFCPLLLDKDDLPQTVDYYTPPSNVTGCLSTATLFLKLLGYTFQKTCFNQNRPSNIIDDASCFGRSKIWKSWWTIFLENLPRLVHWSLIHVERRASRLKPVYWRHNIEGFPNWTVMARVLRRSCQLC